MNLRLVPMILLAFALSNAPYSHAGSPMTKDAKEKPSQSLDGVWVLEAIQQNGTTPKGEQLPVRLRGMTRTIDDRRMTVASSGREYQCSFTVDNTKEPKEIDISVTKEGRVLQTLIGIYLIGIYQIQDDILKIAEDSRERPASFESARGSRSIVYTFKRRKD